MNLPYLITLHLNTLYRCDASSRLLSVNEPGDAYAPPRFIMVRTPQRNFWRFRYDLPLDLARELDGLCASEPVTTDLAPPPRIAPAVHALLARHALPGETYRGPAYWIPERVADQAEAVIVTDANAELLRAGFPRRLPLPRQFDSGPLAAAVVEGVAVAICYCSRLSEGAAEAGVDTLAAFRRKGYASAAVSAWAVAVRQRGLLPMYSTSWENLASQGVARKLGMIQYGEDWSIE